MLDRFALPRTPRHPIAWSRRLARMPFAANAGGGKKNPPSSRANCACTLGTMPMAVTVVAIVWWLILPSRSI